MLLPFEGCGIWWMSGLSMGSKDIQVNFILAKLITA
jgi:hypothetical protein